MSNEIKKVPEDIFADAETIVPQKQNGQQPRMEEIKTMTPKSAKVGLKFNTRLLLVPLIIVIMAGLVYGGYLLIKNLPLRVKMTKIRPTIEQKQTKTTGLILPNKSKSINDNDGDGLSNDEEARLGTDPNSVDTDKDGLFDKEEVSIYKTDPLKADTDGDGVSDGVEVRRGDDPKNPAPGAKLLNLPGAISNLGK